MAERDGEPLSVLRGARLIDGTGKSPTQRGVIVIEGTRIKAIGSETEVTVPENAEIVDLSGYTLLPGLMNVHIHIALPTPGLFGKQEPRIALRETSVEMELLLTAKRCQVMLESGFTTVRDLGGGTTTMMVALRDAFQQGILSGPRLVIGGLAAVTNDHLSGLATRRAGPGKGTADGPWEVRRLTREQLKMGADLIKTSASGGVGSENDPVQRRSITQEELDAIVDEAHAFHKLAACHCHTPESIKMAIQAGVDTFEHCVYTDEEATELLKSRGKVVIPTLEHRTQRSIDAHIKGGYHPNVIAKMYQVKPVCEETFKRYHQAGIKMACGTDSGAYPLPGQSALELVAYVEYGMTPMEAIQTATINAAEALGRQQELGSLEAGKLADVIAVKGHPLHDIRVLADVKNVHLVMKAGEILVDRRS